MSVDIQNTYIECWENAMIKSINRPILEQRPESELTKNFQQQWSL